MTEVAMSAEWSASRPRRLHWLSLLLILGAPMLIVAYLLWAVLRGQGPVVAIGDWQFNAFGQTLPAFNIVLPVILCMLLGLVVDIILTRRWLRQVRSAALDRPIGDALPDDDAAAGSAGRFTHVLMIAGAGLVAGAALLALWTLVLPTRAPLAVIGAVPAGSPAPLLISGQPDGRLTVTVVQDMLVSRRSAYFVPIIDPAEPRTIRNFVEFAAADGWNGTSVPRVDISRPLHVYDTALPRFVRTLYEDGGYAVAPTYRVLTGNPRSIQLPYWIISGQLGLLGVIVLGAAWLQRRHVRKLSYQA